jgi:hypothetical protein
LRLILSNGKECFSIFVTVAKQKQNRLTADEKCFKRMDAIQQSVKGKLRALKGRSISCMEFSQVHRVPFFERAIVKNPSPKFPAVCHAVRPSSWRIKSTCGIAHMVYKYTFSGLEDLERDLARRVDGSSSLMEEESSLSAARNCLASRVRQLSSVDDVVVGSVNDRTGSCCWTAACCLVNRRRTNRQTKPKENQQKYEFFSVADNRTLQ